MLNDPFNTFMGVRIVVRPSPRCEVPWHRKKRIAKKWRKQRGPKYKYFKVNEREIWHDRIHNILYVYPRMERKLRAAMQAYARSPYD